MLEPLVGALLGWAYVCARFARRRPAQIGALECRACGCGPSHHNGGTWGGLLPIEDAYACGGVVRGSAGVFLCPACYVEVGTEVTLFFRELCATHEHARNRPPRKTSPANDVATPPYSWLGRWL